MVTIRKAPPAKALSESEQPDLQRLAASILDAFSDRASASWRDQDCRAAEADSWNIFNAAEPDARLERDDEAGIFPNDGSVWLQVSSQALASVPLAIRALAHLLHWNAGEFQQVIDFVADPPTEPPGDSG